MERFYKRKVDLVVPQVEEHSQIAQTIKKVKVDTRRNVESKKNASQEANLSSLESDYGLRKAIKDYPPPNDQDEVRRRYILKGPHVNQVTMFFRSHHLERKIEDSIQNGFQIIDIGQSITLIWMQLFVYVAIFLKKLLGGKIHLVVKDSRIGKKPKKFGDHVRYPDGAHTYDWNKCNALMNQKQHIATFFHNQCSNDQVEYRIRLESSVDCI
ncbi:hypothetical protein POM88_035933 [Heracleum sosnowskyi]|uniref:Uncharacterized protein n=1 Tax=Heracleum sosnowskyi TaxID=360622 RepID=A0AAD8MDR3_9APIA|nr:hypothetical protein POM88_035933 [Heracleum sosnowskyi]